MTIWRWFLALFSKQSSKDDPDEGGKRYFEADRRRLLDEKARQAEWLRLPPGGGSPG
jgi:hypothetical protein